MSNKGLSNETQTSRKWTPQSEKEKIIRRLGRRDQLAVQSCKIK